MRALVILALILAFAGVATAIAGTLGYESYSEHAEQRESYCSHNPYAEPCR